MLRRRPRRVTLSWLLHPATGWWFLAVLYLAATVVTVVLALSTAMLWPALLAAMLAAVTCACIVFAVRRWRSPGNNVPSPREL